MADFLWTFAAEETLKKVLKVAGEQIGLAWGFEEHLYNLQKWLLKAEAFLRDINTRKFHHHSVRIWVDDLQHLVYEADDLLDEIVYEHLRQKVQTSKTKKVCNFVSPSNNAFIFRRNMAKKMKTVIELLEKHYYEAAPLGLVRNESAGPEIDVISQFRETTSEVIGDHEIVGRDVEVENIVKQVIDASNQQLTSILPIVGMGGLGKTAVAKLLINHEMIRGHFHKTVWVCVSEPFIVNEILREILQNLKGISNGGDSKEVLLRELQKAMHGQRYFLVLDDVWNENAFLWDELKYCLLRITGNSENCIVVTTRSADVAKIMKTHHPSYHLSKLSDDQCWSLFKESANARGLPMTSSLEIFQKKLVKKIGGLPLAARVLGGAVKFEGDVKRWEEMLDSVLITRLEEENFIFSILKLSVDRLPSSSLKQCFAYCSIFPKDFWFTKQELIRMWIAQGFLQPQEGRNTTMENVGDVYFRILLSRCLFQDVVKDEQGIITNCKMHDLVHDIAIAISRDQNLQLNHSIILGKEHQKKESKKVSSKLRTIYFVQEIPQNVDLGVFDKIWNFVCLRVLKICLPPTDKLSESIGQLKHLRYLEITQKRIKFPKSIVLLYNLQTLQIQGSVTEDFPKNFSNLVSLRHLEFWGTVVNKMPPHLRQLTQLQTLPMFVVGLEKGCKISELGPLKDLQGILSLLHLEKVESKEEAESANLAEKNLNGLHLHWSVERKDNRYNDLEVLEGLQPTRNLQSLSINDFAGNCLPQKIMVENLRKILLCGCENCEKLPMLGQLNNLKELEIYNFHGVRSIGNQFYGNDSNQKTFFPKLEIFVLEGMKNLEQWEDQITKDDASSNVTKFPYLKRLKIIGCPKLINIPDVFGGSDENDIQHLESFSAENCNKLRKLPNLGNKLRLSHLSIGPLDKLPEEGLGHLMNLKHIRIIGCIQNYDFSFLGHHHHSLERLALREKLSSVTQLPQQLQFLTALQKLSLENFGGIEALPEWLGNFVSLQRLDLLCCQNLKQFPSKEAMLRLTKLSYLCAYECPQLQLGEGDTERVKLSHLPNIRVYLG
ncbi:putative disease resistance protein RGA3 [Benincasa hispida]|nr:putative disease resistance protein RGA3 [Benincasa hispida]